MNLTLVRHGETLMNKKGLILGHRNLSLNERGAEQARQIAEAFRGREPFILYSSPLARAMETAQAISRAAEAPIAALDTLKEMDAGSLEGLTGPQARTLYPDVMSRWTEDPGSTRMPGGESLGEVQARSWAAVQEMLAWVGEGNVVAVTHNFVISSIVCKILDAHLSTFRSFRLDLGSITRLVIGNDHAVVVSLNDSHHLDNPPGGD